MTEHQASRTLLKSPPELWSECSDPQSLARHLGEFVGEIRITRLESETTVAWEGEHARGTVRLEPSGWGTKVTLTASQNQRCEPVAPADPEPPANAKPAAAVPDEPSRPMEDPAPAPARGGLLARMRRWFASDPAAASATEPTPGSEPMAVVEEPDAVDQPDQAAPNPDAPEPRDAEGALTAALESLGKAHHRPFSRA